MLAVPSAWRANDVVVYDAMRAVATRLTAAVAARAQLTDSGAERARVELTQLRRDVASVDGYDRAAVVALTERIQARLYELEGGVR